MLEAGLQLNGTGADTGDLSSVYRRFLESSQYSEGDGKKLSNALDIIEGGEVSAETVLKGSVLEAELAYYCETLLVCVHRISVFGAKLTLESCVLQRLCCSAEQDGEFGFFSQHESEDYGVASRGFVQIADDRSQVILMCSLFFNVKIVIALYIVKMGFEHGAICTFLVSGRFLCLFGHNENYTI